MVDLAWHAAPPVTSHDNQKSLSHSTSGRNRSSCRALKSAARAYVASPDKPSLDATDLRSVQVVGALGIFDPK